MPTRLDEVMNTPRCQTDLPFSARFAFGLLSLQQTSPTSPPHHFSSTMHAALNLISYNKEYRDSNSELSSSLSSAEHSTFLRTFSWRVLVAGGFLRRCMGSVCSPDDEIEKEDYYWPVRLTRSFPFWFIINHSSPLASPARLPREGLAGCVASTLEQCLECLQVVLRR